LSIGRELEARHNTDESNTGCDTDELACGFSGVNLFSHRLHSRVLAHRCGHLPGEQERHRLLERVLHGCQIHPRCHALGSERFALRARQELQVTVQGLRGPQELLHFLVGLDHQFLDQGLLKDR
jgi:hypothetical protein